MQTVGDPPDKKDAHNGGRQQLREDAARWHEHLRRQVDGRSAGLSARSLRSRLPPIAAQLDRLGGGRRDHGEELRWPQRQESSHDAFVIPNTPPGLITVRAGLYNFGRYSMNHKEFAELRTNIFTEPTSERKKPDLIKYVKILINEASQLPINELSGAKGHDIAMSITGALAFQGANGIEGDDWITIEDEPILYNILDVAGRLDNSPANNDAWQKLFTIVKML